ncbi:MAG: CBO0543 family protein [Bacillota bacterium]
MLKWGTLIISILLFNIVAILMKKRLKISEIYTTVIFALLACTIVDAFASIRFKAWGFFEVEKAEFTVLLILLGIYPAAAAMIINWFPYNYGWWQKLCYLMAWAVLSTVYEWLTIKVGILWHINWNLLYSFVLYPFIYYMLILHVRLYRLIKQRAG